MGRHEEHFSGIRFGSSHPGKMISTMSPSTRIMTSSRFNASGIVEAYGAQQDLAARRGDNAAR